MMFPSCQTLTLCNVCLWRQNLMHAQFVHFYALMKYPSFDTRIILNRNNICLTIKLCYTCSDSEGIESRMLFRSNNPTRYILFYCCFCHPCCVLDTEAERLEAHDFCSTARRVRCWFESHPQQ